MTTFFTWAETYPDYEERMHAIALEAVCMLIAMELGRHPWRLVEG